MSENNEVKMNFGVSDEELMEHVRQLIEDLQALDTKIQKTSKSNDQLANSEKKTSANVKKATDITKAATQEKSKYDDVVGKLGKTFGYATTPMKSFTASFSKMAASFTVGNLAAKAIEKTVVSFVALGKEYTQFESKIAEVNTLVDTSKVNVQELGQEVLGLASKYGKDRAGLTGALYQVISAGINASDAMGVLEVATIAATAGVTDTKTAVDGLTSILNAYKLSADKATEVSDSMFIALKLGKTTFGELSGAIGATASIANSAGLTVDDLNNSIATLTLSGISTSEAGTAIRSMLNNIIKPSKEAKDTAKLLGVQLDISAIKTMGWAGWLNHLRLKTGGSTEALAKLLPDVQALNGAIQLTGSGYDKLISGMDEFNKKAGAASLANEKMTDTIQVQWQKALEGTKNEVIRFMDSGPIKEFLKIYNRNISDNVDRRTIDNTKIGENTSDLTDNQIDNLIKGQQERIDRFRKESYTALTDSQKSTFEYEIKIAEEAINKLRELQQFKKDSPEEIGGNNSVMGLQMAGKIQKEGEAKYNVSKDNEATKKSVEELVKEQEKQAEAEKKLQELRNQQFADYKKIQEEITRVKALEGKSDKEKALYDLREKFKTEFDLFTQLNQDKEDLIDKFRIKEAEINKKYDDEEIARAKEKEEKLRAIIEKREEAEKIVRFGKMDDYSRRKAELDEKLKATHADLVKGMTAEEAKATDERVGWSNYEQIEKAKLSSQFTEEWDAKQKELREQEVAELQEKLGNVFMVTEQAMGSIQSIFDNVNQKRLSQIDKEEDKEIEAIKNSKMSKKEKEKEIEKVEKEAAKKRHEIALKEWQQQLVMSIVNTALSVSQTATMGFPQAIPFMIAAGIAGAVQTGIIAANKPKLKDGGFIPGQSYSGDLIDAGGAMVNSGEAVLNPAQQREFMAIVNGNSRGGRAVSVGDTNIVINGSADSNTVSQIDNLLADHRQKTIEMLYEANDRKEIDWYRLQPAY